MKILVIDDEPAIVTYLTTLLEDHGYETCFASDAAGGIAIARREAPDLICMDIMMPKRSGVALYRDIRAGRKTKDIPVVFVSAYTQVHNTLKPGAPGFFRQLIPGGKTPEPQAFIEKPIKPSDFIAAIATLIGPAAKPADQPSAGENV